MEFSCRSWTLNVACSHGLCDSAPDSSSDYSQRTGFDVPSLQQELRSTPEGARRDPDDPLPDRIKVNLHSFCTASKSQRGFRLLDLYMCEQTWMVVLFGCGDF